jgi:hypothetical protein
MHLPAVGSCCLFFVRRCSDARSGACDVLITVALSHQIMMTHWKLRESYDMSLSDPRSARVTVIERRDERAMFSVL